MNSVLMLGNYRVSIPIAKALAGMGRRVIAGVSGDDAYVHWSRHVAEVLACPPLDTQPDLAMSVIRQFLNRRPDVDLLFPVSEVALRLLTRRREAWAPARVAAADQALVDLCADKPAMFEIARRIGAPLAPLTLVETYEALTAAATEIGFPVVIKPADSIHYVFGRKALFVDDAKMLAAVCPSWPPEPHAQLVVQRVVRGPRSLVLFGAREGRLLGAMEVQALRTTEPDDTGQTCAGVVVEPRPAFRQAAEALIAELEITSVGSVEFLIEPESGLATFLEINPRVDGVSKIAEVSGLPMTRWAVELAEGADPAPFADPWSISVGRRFVWTKGDLTRLRIEARRGTMTAAELGGYAAQAAWDAVRSIHTIFDPLDPMPALGNHLEPLIKRLRRTDLKADPAIFRA